MAVEKLKKQEIFQLLRPEQLNLLSEAAEVVKFKAGQMIYARGTRASRFYIVLKGQVSLRLPGKKEGLSVLIDELIEGDMFGGCVTTALDAYALNAQCMEESEILVLDVSALKAIMDDDPRIGYVIQSRISEIYFRRYIEVMEKLQAIVMNIPVEPA
jgi:CRP-like cAMP-binding protein